MITVAGSELLQCRQVTEIRKYIYILKKHFSKDAKESRMDKLLFTVLRDFTNNLTITILYYTLKLSGMHCAELICAPKKSYRNIIIFYYIFIKYFKESPRISIKQIVSEMYANFSISPLYGHRFKIVK